MTDNEKKVAAQLPNENASAGFKIVISYLEPVAQVFHIYGNNKAQVEEVAKDTFSHLPNMAIESIELVEGEETDTNVLYPEFNKPTLN